MAASKVLHTIEQHILVDGFKIVVDLDKSRGSYLQNSVDNRRLIDFYGFFGSTPVGFNHPHFDDPQVQRDLLRAAKVKIANSDIYSAGYAEFVATFERVVGLPPLQRYLFIEGGALAVENCLKAAMDWKVRKNMAAGHGERGTQILHFRRAFHGRSGYTMSLTNTDPRKTDLFAKFDWPRVSCPSIDFSLLESKREADVIEREQKAEREIRDFIEQRNIDICAIIIEPIQGEGGDNHFRGEWLQKLRKISDENDILLIFDEVQCGMGRTGSLFAYTNYAVTPDILTTAKALGNGYPIGAMLTTSAIASAFSVGSHGTTYGGNPLAATVALSVLKTIDTPAFLARVKQASSKLIQALEAILRDYPQVFSEVRGSGLMLGMVLADAYRGRAKEIAKCAEAQGLMVLIAGMDVLRLLPALIVSDAQIDEAGLLLRRALDEFLLAKQ